MMPLETSPDLRSLPASSADVRPGRAIVVMPAYNAALTLKRTVADIPLGTVDEILVVDDCRFSLAMPAQYGRNINQVACLPG